MDLLPPLALAYHGVASVRLPDDPFRLFVSAGELQIHVRRLRAWGYRFVTFSELAANVAVGSGSNCVALTFDDGFADNAEALVALRRDHDVPTTVFAVSGWLGGTHPDAPGTPMLTAEELRFMSDHGVEIGVHTATHPDLRTLDRRGAAEELDLCRDRLEAVIARPVTVAAYPYGWVTPDAVAACRDVGIKAACMTEGQGSWADPYRLPRQSMGNGDTCVGLRLKRANRHESLMRRWRPAMRTRAGRVAVSARRAGWDRLGRGR